MLAVFILTAVKQIDARAALLLCRLLADVSSVMAAGSFHIIAGSWESRRQLIFSATSGRTKNARKPDSVAARQKSSKSDFARKVCFVFFNFKRFDFLSPTTQPWPRNWRSDAWRRWRNDLSQTSVFPRTCFSEKKLLSIITQIVLSRQPVLFPPYLIRILRHCFGKIIAVQSSPNDFLQSPQCFAFIRLIHNSTAFVRFPHSITAVLVFNFLRAALQYFILTFNVRKCETLQNPCL